MGPKALKHESLEPKGNGREGGFSALTDPICPEALRPSQTQEAYYRGLNNYLYYFGELLIICIV